MTNETRDGRRAAPALVLLLAALALLLAACGETAGAPSSGDGYDEQPEETYSAEEPGDTHSTEEPGEQYSSPGNTSDAYEYDAGLEEYSENDEYAAAGAQEYPGEESTQYAEEEYSASSTTSDADAYQYELPEIAAASPTYEAPTMVGPEGTPLEDFLFAVGEELDAKWSQAFARRGLSWSSPYLQIYQEEGLRIEGCGDVIHNYQGPLYCPDTKTIYYPVPWEVRETGRSLEDFGDFAVAATLAHEMAHHVQGQLGVVADGRNVFTIQKELQADCYAGVWANSVYYEGRLEAGDFEEAVYLLNNIADLPGTPPNDPTAHGTEQQRIDAFAHGYNTGDLNQC